MFADLIEKKLVKEKKYPNGLSIYKYNNRVFYDNLWHLDNRILEARGMVLNSNGEKVIWPFTKVFNRFENGTDCDPNSLVEMVEKVNGFMAAARMWNGELLVSSTGTLDSDYVKLARKVIMGCQPLNADFWDTYSGLTLMFEICDESDPHIVEEKPGAYLIGGRDMTTGDMLQEAQLDVIADEGGFLRPQHSLIFFDQLTEVVKTYKKEGFMVRDGYSGKYLMKIKSPHYLIKKFLMRMGDAKTKLMFTDTNELFRQLDEEFYCVIEWIITNFTEEQWTSMNDQVRRAKLEEYFG
jgi:hypothetical protein